MKIQDTLYYEITGFRITKLDTMYAVLASPVKVHILYIDQVTAQCAHNQLRHHLIKHTVPPLIPRFRTFRTLRVGFRTFRTSLETLVIYNRTVQC